MRLRSLLPRILVTAIVAAISLFSPSVCMADPADVVTYNFTGVVSCISPLTCGTSTGTVTGTYSFDRDTETIVGAWSFSTPDGIISSTEVGSSTLVQEGGVGGLPAGVDVFFFESPGVTPFLSLIFRDPQDEGSLAPRSITNNVDSGLIGPAGLFKFTSGAATPTPEPSSLLLLGTGLLGLGPFIRRRFART